MEELEIPMPGGKQEPFIHSCSHSSMSDRGGKEGERKREGQGGREEKHHCKNLACPLAVYESVCPTATLRLLGIVTFFSSLPTCQEQ